MDSLVVENIKHRKMRTAASVMGVALGVILITLTVGLAHGMVSERASRESNLGAEIIFRTSLDFTTTRMQMPIQYTDALLKAPGVAKVTPIGQYLKSGSTGLGVEIVEGITYQEYAGLNPLFILDGNPLPEDGPFVLIDETYARLHKVGPGSRIQFFNQDFTVSGVYGPERGSRLKIPLPIMQRLLGSENRCSMIYVKVTPEYASSPETVAKNIRDAFPGNYPILTADIWKIYDAGLPQLNIFLSIVVWIALIVSTLVVLLAMYTTITERTREIGILKSLGASKGFIVGVIEREAALISALGILLGGFLALIASIIITRTSSLVITLEWQWMLISAAIASGGGLLGALYPAVRAAAQDPMKALNYE